MSRFYVRGEVQMTNGYAVWWERVERGPFWSRRHAEYVVAMWSEFQRVRSIVVTERRA